MPNLRRLGRHAENLPTKKTKTVTASDFLIGGMIGQFERKYKSAFEARSLKEFQEIFGDHVDSSFYGSDAVNGLFSNLVGVQGKVYIKSHVGHTGSAFDAVTATKNFDDQAVSPKETIKVEDGYVGELGFGVSGNRTGIKITNGVRYTTAVSTSGTKDDTFALCDSIIGVKVGDIIKMVGTGGGGATVYKKVTSIDSNTGALNFSGAFHASANLETDDVVTVLGFQLQVYRKTIDGVVTEVDKDLGKVWCTMEPEVSDYYVENVFSTSKNIIVTDLGISETSINEEFPADVSTVTYLASGADGTSPTTSAMWAEDLLAFDNLPVRFLGNPETTDSSIQSAGETYCKGRWDNPKWIYNIASDRTKAQLLTIGNNYQRGDDVLGVIAANWLEISDPFASSPLAPKRQIPNIGHVMGAWIRVIGLYGIHYIPAIQEIPLYGVEGIVGDQLLDDEDRTDVANAGINMIQKRSSGYQIANLFTPSITTEYKFANGILMRSYFQVSAVDSLATSENKPNSLKSIKDDRQAVYTFMNRVWVSGSTGTAPEGETFGQSENDDGTTTKFDDHVEVIANSINNPQWAIDLGQADIYIYFSYPTPKGSIKIGAGLLLR